MGLCPVSENGKSKNPKSFTCVLRRVRRVKSRGEESARVPGPWLLRVVILKFDLFSMIKLYVL